MKTAMDYIPTINRGFDLGNIEDEIGGVLKDASDPDDIRRYSQAFRHLQCARLLAANSEQLTEEFRMPPFNTGLDADSIDILAGNNFDYMGLVANEMVKSRISSAMRRYPVKNEAGWQRIIPEIYRENRLESLSQANERFYRKTSLRTQS